MENTLINAPKAFDPNGFDLTDPAIDHFKKSLKNFSLDYKISCRLK